MADSVLSGRTRSAGPRVSPKTLGKKRRQERRRSRRFPATHRAEYLVNDRRSESFLADLSLGGMCLRSAKDLEKGAPVEFKLHLEDMSQPLVVHGHVVADHRETPGGGARVAFDEGQPKAYHRLRAYVESYVVGSLAKACATSRPSADKVVELARHYEDLGRGEEAYAVLRRGLQAHPQTLSLYETLVTYLIGKAHEEGEEAWPTVEEIATTVEESRQAGASEFLASVAAELDDLQRQLDQQRVAAKRRDEEARIAEQASQIVEEQMRAMRQEHAAAIAALEKERDAVYAELRRERQAALQVDLQPFDDELEALRASSDEASDEFDLTIKEPEEADELSIEEAREKLFASKSELARLQQELDTMRVALEERDKEMEARDSEIDFERDQLDQLASTLAVEREAANREASELMESYRQQRETLESERAQLEESRADLERERQDLETRRGELDRQRKLLERRDSDVAEREKNIEQIRRELDAFQGALDERRQELAFERKALDARAYDLDKRETRVARARAATEVERADIEMERLRVASIASEVQRQQDALEARELREWEHRHEIAAGADDLSALETRAEAIDRQRQLADEQLADRERALTRSRKENVALQQQMHDAYSRAADAERARDQARERLDELRQAMAEAELHPEPPSPAPVRRGVSVWVLVLVAVAVAVAGVVIGLVIGRTREAPAGDAPSETRAGALRAAMPADPSAEPARVQQPSTEPAERMPETSDSDLEPELVARAKPGLRPGAGKE